MNKISYSQLESARNNPKVFANTLKSGGNPIRFKKPPKFTIWKNSIFDYHKKKNNLPEAINYFQNSFFKHYANNRKNVIERDNWVNEIQNYAQDEIKRKLTFCDKKVRTNIDLTNKLKLGGELPLIKMNYKGGYSVYFFSRENTLWENELRFPIIQNYVASTLYGVDLSDVEVGVYSLVQKKHLQKIFTQREIDEAEKELKAIGKVVSLAL